PTPRSHLFPYTTLFRSHLWAVARQLYPQGEVQQKAWMKVHQKRLLDKGKIEKLVGALRAIHAGNPAMAEKIRTEADYFERNAERSEEHTSELQSRENLV